MKKWVEIKIKYVEFKEGSLAMVKLLSHQTQRFAKIYKGLARRYEGPFPIEKRVENLTYLLTLPSHLEVHFVFHVSLLKPCYEDTEDPNRGKIQ